MPPLPLAEQVRAVTEAVLPELEQIWRVTVPQAASDALFELLPPFIDTWTVAVAALAADWYDDLREEEQIPGVFTAIVPDLGDQGADELAGFASEAILGPEPDFALFRSRVEGGAQRRIANAARETVMTSSVQDPKARGWRRVVRPGACGFCRMLAARGYAYKTKDSSTFGSHDHCSCSAEPGWSGGKAVKVRKFEPSTKDTTKAERDAVYKWIKEHQPIA